MIPPGFVEVLFDLPKDIAGGLADKSLERVGGVIRWATGPTKGQVVMWLRESGGLAKLSQLGGVPAPGH